PAFENKSVMQKGRMVNAATVVLHDHPPRATGDHTQQPLRLPKKKTRKKKKKGAFLKRRKTDAQSTSGR
ncbi:hypothetical protein BGZ65_007601, partial [Modicella reniformis]